MIYFIKIDKFDLVKIGHTNDIKSRLAELQVACPFKLKCIKLISILGKEGESFLHQVFISKKTLGEWFVYDSFIKNFVKKLHEKAEYKITEIESFLRDCSIPIPDYLTFYSHQKKISFRPMMVNSEKILLELTKLDWTQSELARKLEMTRSNISLILKRQKTSFKTITKIGETLNIDPKDLLI